MAQIPHADSGLDCPLHRKPMDEVCHKCPWWLQIRGLNRNTGVEVDNWGCAVGFLPMLLIENACQTRGAAAATEEARNGIVDVFEGMTQSLLAIAREPAKTAGEGARVIAAAAHDQQA
jgi:hypothetical protein